MGIKKQDFFVAKCDYCGEYLQNGEGGILCCKTKGGIKDHMKFADWKKKNGKISCENCWEN